jgi:hypothetical protein
MDSLTGASPRQLARIAGALYLINIVCGAFAIGFVPATLFASDPATTAANIRRTSCSTGPAWRRTSW